MAKKQDKILGLFILGAFVIFIGILLLVFFSVGSMSGMEIDGVGDKVAVVELNGIIASSREVVAQFKRYEKDKSIKAIVFRINSPGGGVAASQEIYEQVRRVRDSGKPVVASMGSVAASGGYYVALGADSIMANPATTTGSIGVLAEFPNYSKLMEKIGIQVTTIKSGQYKDTGNPYRDITPADREYLQAWIDDGYDQFITAVADERGLLKEEVRRLADGRVYSGRQAYELSLIDSLGTFEDAIQLAADVAGIDGEPRLVRQPRKKTTMFELLFEFDLKEFIETYFSAWPRIQYLMSF
ncbi:signal peptide peptidase SppA [candidate division KSB1 bacterium]|nr:signal peptide peptidase SppA [candidate division KSB1 bacterium]RQW01410.1 MAG: signal peptide peptidase SppA [candidate division KSB1 bacterium]